MKLNLPVQTRASLARDLCQAGIEPGDTLVVHSSLRRVGWVDGGPTTLLGALQDVLGPSGTLVLPTFSFNLALWSLPPFDPWQTPSRVGALTEAFRHQPGVLRSHHPTHSVAAWGRLSWDIVGGPPEYEPLGIESPLDRARRAGARILLLGVGNNRNSTVHVAESLAAMPYLSVPFSDVDPHDEAWYMDEPGGEAHVLFIQEMPGSSEGFSVLDRLLEDNGIARPSRIGAAESWLMDSAALCDFVVDRLRDNPFLFLFGDQPSEITLRRRRYLQRLRRRSAMKEVFLRRG